jgi:outer membrane immunogenic protein
MWSKTSGNFSPVFPAFPWDAPYNSALGGVQAGFNWQFNQFVIGVEGSWDGTFNSNPGSTVGNAIAGPCGFVAVTESCRARINDIASAGGRLGWTPMPQWLLSAQGGWAGAKISTDGILNATGVIFSPASAQHNGWFAGGSVDYAVTPIVSVGIDYKHYEFRSADHTAAIAGDSRSVSAKADAVLAHINFKFWGPGGLIH